LTQPFEQLFPPGYLSAESRRNMRLHKRSITAGDFTVDLLMELGIILCGSPDTVRGRLAESHRALGFQNFLGLLQFGTLPPDLTERNIRLFAAEVLPALQGLSDKDYAGMAKQAAE
jgi:alkanesulfonate monooxygenase SsuD/methylene tetrahydromethanopterin reductase-like flavin-dependent oxidoreductase (luciferase family)